VPLAGAVCALDHDHFGLMLDEGLLARTRKPETREAVAHVKLTAARAAFLHDAFRRALAGEIKDDV
jgi:hypothetical protein